MAIEVKRGLLQRKYAWEAVAGDDPRARVIDARLLNRHEGYEVIPMIQKIVDRFGYETESDVARVEALIADELPGDVRGRRRVFDWLVERLEKESAGEAPENAAPAEAEAAAAERAAAEEAAGKAAALRAAALLAKWQVPETWRFSLAEMRKKVAVYAAFENVARHLVAAYEAGGELPATFSAGSAALAQGSANASVEIGIARYDCEKPPAGSYHGQFAFVAGDSQAKVAYRLDFEHTGNGASGSSEPERAA